MIRQRYNSNFVAGNDRRCNDLLRRLLRNPPNNTKIAINIGLSKARYLCHEGFELVGKKMRTCKGGKWRESLEPKCLSKFKWEHKIPCYTHNTQHFWTSFTTTRNFNMLYFIVVGGSVASWLVRSSPDRAVRVRALAGDIVLCSWARHLTLTVLLSTQVYKWVPANLMLGVTLRWTGIPSRGE